MTKEEYAEELKSIDREISDLNRKKRGLYETYRSLKREYQNGDRVILHNDKGNSIPAYIRGCGVHDNGIIYYTFNKQKKDGSMSMQRVRSWDFEIKSIELITPANTETK